MYTCLYTVETFNMMCICCSRRLFARSKNIIMYIKMLLWDRTRSSSVIRSSRLPLVTYCYWIKVKEKNLELNIIRHYALFFFFGEFMFVYTWMFVMRQLINLILWQYINSANIIMYFIIIEIKFMNI